MQIFARLFFQYFLRTATIRDLSPKHINYVWFKENRQLYAFAGIYLLPNSDIFIEVFPKNTGVRRSHGRCSVKKSVLKNLANFTGKQLCWSLFLIKLQALARNLIEKRLATQVFSYEICENLKNPYVEKHLQTTASEESSISLCNS